MFCIQCIPCNLHIPPGLLYQWHLSRQQNLWSLRWSIASRCCSNYIFFLDLTHGFNGLSKDNCNTRRETFRFIFSFGTCYIRRFTIILWCFGLLCLTLAIQTHTHLLDCHPYVELHRENQFHKLIHKQLIYVHIIIAMFPMVHKMNSGPCSAKIHTCRVSS